VQNLPQENKLDNRNEIKQYYKPDFSILFKKIKGIKTPLKNNILISLLDGGWHPETELIRIAKKQNAPYVGDVTLGTMVHSLNHLLKSNYLEKRFINGEMYYKISDNYVGLTRAAYTKYSFKLD
jgi:hypothetical protein